VRVQSCLYLATSRARSPPTHSVNVPRIIATESVSRTLMATTEVQEPLQADDEDYDSGMEDGASVESASLQSSILNYIYENGRRYHAYRAGEYPLPNDENEQSRMDLLHPSGG
jgi:hypothetical protein